MDFLFAVFEHGFDFLHYLLFTLTLLSFKSWTELYRSCVRIAGGFGSDYLTSGFGGSTGTGMMTGGGGAVY
jgi:hypothetical protein